MSLTPSTWPMVVKVPLFVATLVILMSVVVSNLIVTRLVQGQEASLNQLTEAYLDGVSAALTNPVIREDIWEVFDVLDQAQKRYETVKAVYTVVALPNGTVLAASDPKRFTPKSTVPSSLTEPFQDDHYLHIEEQRGVAWGWRRLMEAGQPIGDLYTEINIAHLLAERRQVLSALISGAVMLTLLFAGAGFFAVRSMVQPITQLGGYLEGVRHGTDEPIPIELFKDEKTEFGRLFRRFNDMKVAIRQRQELADRLAEEEKLAILGKLASGMAHEVNNPLGGMGNAIDTIRKHGGDEQVRNRSLGILERGLDGIAKVTQATLATYKGGGKSGHLTRRDLEDIKFLVHHKIERRNIDLKWNNETPAEMLVDGSVTRQIVLNLLLNACESSPKGGDVLFHASAPNDQLSVVVQDQGPGIPEPVAAQLRGDMISTLTEGAYGLGAWTVGTLLKRLGGNVEIVTLEGGGTKVTILLPLCDRGG
ncbi:sensor histidine kinase [Pseudomonadota bacterium]